jgi:malate synthase
MATPSETRSSALNAAFASEGVEFRGHMPDAAHDILTPEAVRFVASLARRFESTRRELLTARDVRQSELTDGRMPDFLPETASIRQGDWKTAPIPAAIQERRVEITGPVDRKMVINALNSGADVFMADFEDSNSPTWRNNLEGQLNLRDAVRREIAFTSPEGKEYRLNDRTAILFMRPRGWHLVEKHMLVDGAPVSGSLFDFGLFFFHNAAAQIDAGFGPYFYLPKMESHLEARLWNDVFRFAQDALGIPQGSIRATVLIETILAAFEMDEILFELRDHSAGLNCGRWDYIFNFIKKFRHRPEFVLPDRSQVTMDRHFLRSYVDLLIQTCHRRGIFAMGGMAAQIPIKHDAEANRMALEKVRQDKLREVRAGHDGTWVAHPGLVGIAKEVFAAIEGPNQISVSRPEVAVAPADLLTVPDGTITEQGLQSNIDVGIQYLESWLRGNGCVPIYNLMEDAATAEISRTQVWQWSHHGAKLVDGRRVDADMIHRAIPQQLEKARTLLGAERFDSGRFDEASSLFDEMMTGAKYHDFLTLAAYDLLE